MDRRRRELLAVECYRILLKIPIDSMLRTEAHDALCLCRDTIAECTGMTPENVQTLYETLNVPSAR
jgi:hypothetical protein